MVEPKPVQLVEEKVGLILRKAQLLGIDLDQITTGAHPSEREGWLRAASQDQLESPRKVIDEVNKPLVDLWIGDQMVVVKDEHQLARYGHEFGA